MYSSTKIASESVICDECKSVFLYGSINIDKCYVDCNGTMLHLTYYMCPVCGAVYKILLVDGKKYRDLIADYVNTRKRIERQRGKENEQLLQQLVSMAHIKQRRIREYVKEVNKKFPGTFQLVASENNEPVMIYVP